MVSNGQIANQGTFNQAFLSRINDSNTLGRIDLQNPLPESGEEILNLQRNINAIASALGIPVNQVADFLITWADNFVGANNDTVVARVNALVQLFSQTAGHTHSGVDGQGPQLSAANLADINQFAALYQGFAVDLDGFSVDVSSLFVGKIAGGTDTQAGVITTSPNNKVQIFSSTDGDTFEDSEGRRIYGRLTEAAGVWTLSFYVLAASTEIPYDFPGPLNANCFHLEVFNLANRPTIPATPDFGSLNVSADVPDASQTQRGLVSTTLQDFAGDKNFFGAMSVLNAFSGAHLTDSFTTGANAVAINSPSLILELTNAGLTSLAGITAGLAQNNKLQIVINKTGAPLPIRHDFGSDGFLIPGGEDFELDVQCAMLARYDHALERWQIISGGGKTTIGKSEIPAGAINGVNTSFGPLAFVPADASSIVVYLNGLALTPDEWTLSGQNVVLDVAPTAGQVVSVFYLTGGSLAPAPSVSGVWKTEYITLSASDITAKQVVLAQTPVVGPEILVDVKGGPAQFYGDDFIVTGNILSWDTLGLETLLSAGDKLRVGYVY